ncbi:hypothetical protein LJ656_25945 [Paraburkholderia sp. MMS20-SJTR3]|uniref:Uncharacterized protein n=1 Tax=Paraburkholderia sejongensis TaxID=2886946 RepID=A0ABS8K1K0_9BURK|nr:hypothetical protein [Paraburkholderia sp. MMS20-SJTR3]MCC8396034.1 hypothetical protein [Paraburkholderia sp. MMS20-SJTR3]
MQIDARIVRASIYAKNSEKKETVLNKNQISAGGSAHLGRWTGCRASSVSG